MLYALRQDFPFLANAIIGYARGEVWVRQGLGNRTWQLANATAFATAVNLSQLKIHEKAMRSDWGSSRMNSRGSSTWPP